ncbi:heavy metal-binding protein HIP-like [Mercenaria mercenaria]|uniref:heavy metal-binding protein HIP-like n=1 Tax=Mercenaria mercenaria TaxID=6596 RepID=UPI00234E8B86|nr:heavy metal-binding protein HIP-like [Mercenaria mercenaria]
MIINMFSLFRSLLHMHLVLSVTGFAVKRILVLDDFYTLVNKLNGLENEVTALKQEVKALKAQQANQTGTVAFMAFLTKSERGTNHHILFDDVKINVGNAYNPRHGLFVAPVPGLYQFSLTACSDSNHYIVLELNVKDSIIGKVIAGDDWVIDCSSKTFIVQLAKGDDVFVMHRTVGESLLAGASYDLPNFTGFLIKET